MAQGGKLRRAAELGDVERLRELVADGVNVDSDDDLGNTALHRAAGYGHADAVELLLEQGASVKKKGWGGRLALHRAAESASASSVALLLAAGAKAHCPTSPVTPGGRYNLTPLFCAINHSRPSSILCVRLLIQAGARVNHSTSWYGVPGWTPLHRAIDHGRCDLVKALLRASAEIRAYPNNLNRKSSNEAAFAAVDRVKKAGGWAEFAKQHERVLVGLVTKCAPIPDDAARLVVAFYCPPGGS